MSSQKAKLLPIRVTDWVVVMDFGALAEAIHYAVDEQCHVISISLGGPIRSRTLHRAIQRAVESGVVVLAAAGNVWPWVVCPARFDECLAVAACNCLRKVWRDSAGGDEVDITAPGESVWVARTSADAPAPRYEHDRGSGTSYAVATTAGACALWLAFHGREALIAKYGAANVASVFKELVMRQGVDTPTGWDTGKHGAGILNVEKLLKAPLPPTPHAAGMHVRASATPAPLSVLDEIATFFPGVRLADVRSGLGRFLKTDEARLATLLGKHGDEILFHVATNALVRAKIRTRPGVPVRAAPRMRARGRARFMKCASPPIKARASL